jgi:lactoylglutathione lyase
MTSGLSGPLAGRPASAQVLGLAHVGLRVADAERSGHFYRMFGFEWAWRGHADRVHVMRHGSGLELNLVERADAAGPNLLMDERPRSPGYTHVALRVRDVRAMAAQLAQAGIRITEGPLALADGSTALFVRDPDGNVVEFSQPGASNGRFLDWLE